MRPLVKICGITRPEDGVVAARAGADFIGMVFHESSPRHVSIERARAIVESLAENGDPPAVVGVFVDRPMDEVNRIASEVPLDLIQFHGDEKDELIGEVSLPVIKALRIRDELPDLDSYLAAHWILYDTFVDGAPGGTGRMFDWSLLDRHPRNRKFFLSGGLNAENVNAAIARARPNAIDVSSGVESAPGIKSTQKIATLFESLSKLDTEKRGRRTL